MSISGLRCPRVHDPLAELMIHTWQQGSERSESKKKHAAKTAEKYCDCVQSYLERLQANFKHLFNDL